MANTTNIHIRKSTTTAIPPTGNLEIGELAYSYVSNTMFIGGSDELGILPIGGYSQVVKLNAAFDAANVSSYAYDAANAVYTFSANTVELIANSAYAKANAANILADATYTYAANAVMLAANSAYAKANAANTIAEASFIQANSANIIALAAFDKANTGTSGGAAFDAANAAFAQANMSNTIAIAAFEKANTGTSGGAAFDSANAAYDKANAANLLASTTYTYSANNVMLAANSAFAMANAANLMPVGNTASNGYFSIRSTKRQLNFIPGSLIAINVADDATLNTANVTIDATLADPQYAFAKANLAYTYSANDAMSAANAAFAKANTANITADATYTFAANNVRLIANAAYAAQNTTYTFAANTVRLIANSAYAAQNSTYTYAANVVMSAANAAFSRANGANIVPVGNTMANGYFTVRSSKRQLNFKEGTNVTITVDDDATLNTANITISAATGSDPLAPLAYAKANAAYTFAANDAMLAANSAYAKANAANITADSTYTYAANVVMSAANAAFAMANAANLMPVGNTISNGYFSVRSTRRRINFLEGSNITINVDDDPTLNTANITITSTASGGDPQYAFAKANAAYTFAANDAMLAANSAYAAQNTTYTYSANVVMSASNAAFAMANAANLMPVGNTIANGYWTIRSTRRRINFIPGASHITINVDDDPTLNTANVTINSTEFGAAYALANATWTYAANNVMLAANSAYAAQNSTYTFSANTVRLIANSAYAGQNATYTYAANVVMSASNAAFAMANAANLMPVGNTMANGYYTNRATRRNLNFIPGSLITINVNDDPTLNTSNITIDATAADPQYAFAKANLAYTYAANDAMLAANSAYAAQNSTYTYAANNVMLAANSAYTAQNSTYTYAANIVMSAANSAYAKANAANITADATYTFAANTVRLIANSAYAAQNTTYGYASNQVMSAANAAFAMANAANLIPIGNTIGANSYFTVRSTRRRLNFVEGTNVTITVDDDPTLNTANITINAAAGSDPIAGLAYTKANAAYTYAANDAMLAANSAYAKANAANATADSNYTYASNVVMSAANAAFSQANGANLMPVGNTISNGYFSVRSSKRRLNFIEGSNITINVDDDATLNTANITITSTASGGDPQYAFAKANLAYTYAANDAMLAANSAYAKANAANITADSTYTYAANNVMSAANAAFAMANAANLMPVGNTMANGYWTVRSTKRQINFIPGSLITINVNNDATLNTANVIIDATAADPQYAFAKANLAYTYAANDAMLAANSAYAAQNTTYTYAANNVMLAANNAYAAQNTTYGYAANQVMSAANAAFAMANAANLMPIGNTIFSNNYHTVRATRRKINFIPGAGHVTINVNDDATINAANVIISTTEFGASYALANATWTYAANNVMLAANSAYAAGNTTWTYAANNVMLAANSAYTAQNATYTYAANQVMSAANAAFAMANAANLMPVGNTMSNSYFTVRATRRRINFIEGSNITIKVDDDPTLNTSNITITASVTGGDPSFAFDRANIANLQPVGNTMSNGYFTVRSTANKLNFIPGAGITINVDNDATLNTSNITVAANLTVRSANIVNVTVSATAPTNNVAGDIWIDIS